jgi:hypothetical protein
LGLFAGATEMSDDLAVAGSDSLPSASILSNSSSSNAPSDRSKQLPQSAVDAWNLTAKFAKTAQDTGWQPVSSIPRPAEAASPSNSQHRGLNFALAPSNADPSTGAQWMPPGGTNDPKTDTWERTRDWPRGLNPIDPATVKPSLSQPPSSLPYGLPQSTPSSAASAILPNAPTRPAKSSTAPRASFAERFGSTSVSFAHRFGSTRAQTAGSTSAAAGAAAEAPHSPAARSAGATPSPIGPESLPPGPLNRADDARVGERNRYLASEYDPNMAHALNDLTPIAAQNGLVASWSKTYQRRPRFNSFGGCGTDSSIILRGGKHHDKVAADGRIGIRNPADPDQAAKLVTANELHAMRATGGTVLIPDEATAINAQGAWLVVDDLQRDSRHPTRAPVDLHLGSHLQRMVPDFERPRLG